MSKPYLHSLSAAKRLGGVAEDYMPINEFLDSSKSVIADNRHRALLHSSFGLFILEKVFGSTFKNSLGKVISTRDVGELHILEDFNGRFIPSASDYLQEMRYCEWMQNGRGEPPASFKLIAESRKTRTKTIPLVD